MNKTKRGFELAGAIISIVLSVLLILGSLGMLVTFYSSSSNDSQMEVALNIIRITSIFLLLLSIVTLILSIILCVPPSMVDGKYKSRFGVSLTLTIILGLIALLEMAGGALLYFILFAIPLAFIIVSMCLKHNVVYDTSNITSIYHYNNQKVDNNEQQDNQNQ